MSNLRPPIAVILGHVDHGKTSLLDFIRKSNIAQKEAGGITQHIRSFQVQTSKSQPITFIDTPGHAAFSNMRKRGSDIADMAILVVSADDGVMPQTRQSIEFINSSQIPCIVAITKSDLPSANPDKVKTQLTEAGIVVEDYGGPVPCVQVSSKTGQGIPELLEMIQLVYEINPPKPNQANTLICTVLESRLDPKKGSLATVIIRNGELSVGTSLFTDKPIGKVRSLINPNGESVTIAHASQPVEILGLNEVVPAGEMISDAVLNLSTDRSSPSKDTSSSDVSKINVILKADVSGSLEAIQKSLPPEVNLIESSTGDVTEGDVLSAKNTSSIIVAFGVKISPSCQKLAEVDKVQILSFRIIYELLDNIDKILNPPPTEEILGKASVLATFDIDGDLVVGAKCSFGYFQQGQEIKLERDSNTIGHARSKSLKIKKQPVDQVKIGQEFGMIIFPKLDVRVGDEIISYRKYATS